MSLSRLSVRFFLTLSLLLAGATAQNATPTEPPQAGARVAIGGKKPAKALELPRGVGGPALSRPVSRANARGMQVDHFDGSIQFDPSTLKASFGSVGLYNLVGLDTWNGQPISDTNRPNRALVLTTDFNI